MDKEKKNIQQINIELEEKVSSGEYANFVVVTHSPAEFVMDFTRILPGVPKAKAVMKDSHLLVLSHQKTSCPTNI